ncbi:MAG: uracil-DNA glycosylase [Mariniblastus sp.]|nr:uracil-DNA glycosylase [Mariniblastus sp.]
MTLSSAWPRETDWNERLGDYLASPSFERLDQYMANERKHHTVYPCRDQVFRAFQLTPFAQTRVVILGQDPYHGPGQADGLAFSVPPGFPPPPSLRNILQELTTDLNLPLKKTVGGDLTSWARQGVLLLNTVLTVRQGEAGSHQKQGWETLTDHVMESLNHHPQQLVFILWGQMAGRKAALIDSRHTTIQSAHPSPLSCYRGFWGSRPFSRANAALESDRQRPICWESVFQPLTTEPDPR